MTDRPGSGSFGEVRERREDLRQRMIEVEAAAARPAGGDPALWHKSMRHDLEALHEAWVHHVETTERPDGFLEEVISHAPQLASRRDMLLRDHVAITEQFDALLAVEAASVDETRDGVVDLLGALVRHRHRGAEFTYDAYNVDLAECD
jgi:hypothetical protein